MIKIRGQTVESKDKVTIERKFAEEHDTGRIKVVSPKNTRYEMYSTVDYTEGTTDEQMLVESDSVIQVSVDTYEHTISLLENKAKFDGIYPADRSFTKIGQTLGNILNVYKRELEEYHNILISWNLTTDQLNNIIPFKDFSGVNFTTILVSLFRKVDAIPYVVRQNGLWQINARAYNERGALISGDSITKSFVQSNLDYATKVKAQLKNAINERAQVDVEWFPSENGYVLPKSPKPIKATSDLEYQLPSPIVKMLEVVAVDVPYSYTYDPPDAPITRLFATTNVDLTAMVVTQEVYDSLDIVSTLDEREIANTDNQKNHVIYNQFGKEVGKLFESDTDKRYFIGFNTYYLLNALRRILQPIVDAIQYTTFVGLDKVGDFPLKTEEVKLRFKYVYQRNMDIISNRKTKGDMNTTTTIHNQRDSSVEVSQYKKALKNYANRMGNNEYSKSKNFFAGETPHSIGDFLSDGKVVVQVNNTYHANFTYCEWIEVDNFANLEAEYAISRNPSPYTINNKTVQTNLVSEEYVWFSETRVGVDTRLDDFGQRGLLGLFESDFVPNFNKMHSAVFKPVLPSWDSTKAISMELAMDGDANLITFHTYFEHQLIAGNVYYDFSTNTIGDLQPLKYTDDNGELEDFKIYFVPDILFNDSGEYPLITDEADYLNNRHTSNTIIEPLDLDINAAFAFTYNISFVADQNIFVGEFLARNNYLISDQQDEHLMGIYKSTKPYTLYDQEPRTTDTLANMTYTYDFTNRKITFFALENIEHFAFTKNGKILLAANKSMVSGDSYTIYINIVKKLLDSVMVTQIDGDMVLSGNLTVSQQQYFKHNIVGDMTISGSLVVEKQEFFTNDVSGNMTMTGLLDVIKLEAENYAVSVSGSMVMTSTEVATDQEYYQVDTTGNMVFTGTTTELQDEFIVLSDDVVGAMVLSGTLTATKNEDLDIVIDVVGTMSMTGTTTVVQDEFEVANADVNGTMVMTGALGVIQDEFEVFSSSVSGSMVMTGSNTVDECAVISCSFDLVGTISSPKDLTNDPACSDGVRKYQCTLQPDGSYLCEEYVGNETIYCATPS